MELESNDPWVEKGYGQGRVTPGERPALLVVDLQYAFTDPDFVAGGAPLIDRAVENAARLAETARRLGVPVFQTSVVWNSETELGVYPFKLPYTREMRAGTRWAQPDARVYDPERDIYFPKSRPSFFHATPLLSALVTEQIDTLILTGCTTSGCIRATAVDAFSYSYRTLVPEDACGDQGEDAHYANLRDIHRRYVEVTDSDTVIDYLESLPPRGPRVPMELR